MVDSRISPISDGRDEGAPASTSSIVFIWTSLFLKPRIRPRHVPHRTSWNELWYDLLMVSAITLNGSRMHINLLESVTWSSQWTLYLEFVTRMMMSARVWADSVRYINLFVSEDMFHKLLFMLAFFLLNLSAIAADGDNFISVAAPIFFCCQTLILLAHTRVCTHIDGYAFPAFYSTSGFTIAAVGLPLVTMLAVWVSGVLEKEPAGYAHGVVLVGCLLQEFGVGLMQAWALDPIPLTVDHAEERLGLLTIILLGEVIVGAVGKREASLVLTMTLATAGVFISFLMQLIYFDVDRRSRTAESVRHMERDAGDGQVPRRAGVVWLWLHFVIAVCVVAGASTLVVILEAPPRLTRMMQVTTSVSFSAGILTMTAMTLLFHEGRKRVARKFARRLFGCTALVGVAMLSPTLTQYLVNFIIVVLAMLWAEVLTRLPERYPVTRARARFDDQPRD